MTWEQIKEGLYALAAGAFLIQFWMLKGQVTEFLNNHWPHLLKTVDGLHKKVDKNSEGLARLEGKE